MEVRGWGPRALGECDTALHAQDPAGARRPHAPPTWGDPQPQTSGATRDFQRGLSERKAFSWAAVAQQLSSCPHELRLDQRFP